MKSFWMAFCLIALSFLGGCAPSRSLIVLLPDADGKVGALQVESGDDTVAVDKAYYAVNTNRYTAPASPRLMKRQDVEVKFDQALSTEPTQRYRFKKKTFYCHRDATELTPPSKAALPETIRDLLAKPPLEIYVVGHADRVGTERYNRQLSHKRALAVKREIVENGVNSKIIMISFLGESIPQIDTPDEVQEPRNRRVELVLKYEKSE